MTVSSSQASLNPIAKLCNATLDLFYTSFFHMLDVIINQLVALSYPLAERPLALLPIVMKKFYEKTFNTGVDGLLPS